MWGIVQVEKTSEDLVLLCLGNKKEQVDRKSHKLGSFIILRWEIYMILQLKTETISTESQLFLERLVRQEVCRESCVLHDTTPDGAVHMTAVWWLFIGFGNVATLSQEQLLPVQLVGWGTPVGFFCPAMFPFLLIKNVGFPLGSLPPPTLPLWLLIP